MRQLLVLQCVLLTSRLLGDGLRLSTAGAGVLIVGHVGNVATVTTKVAQKISIAALYPGPNSLIFSFSSGASPAHNAGGRVLPLFSQLIFLTKEVDKRDGKMIVAHYQPLWKGSFGCCAPHRHVC